LTATIGGRFRHAPLEKQNELPSAMLTTVDGEPGPVVLYFERQKTVTSAKASAGIKLMWIMWCDSPSVSSRQWWRSSSLPVRRSLGWGTSMWSSSEGMGWSFAAANLRWRRLHSALQYLRPIDYYRGDPVRLLEERRRKLAVARHQRRERNLELSQPTFASEATDSEVRRPPISGRSVPLSQKHFTSCRQASARRRNAKHRWLILRWEVIESLRRLTVVVGAWASAESG
jgi:hypothetical protein